MDNQTLARVLLVDNDPRVETDLRIMFERRGYRFEAARVNAEGFPDNIVEFARRFRPHVAIVDLRLMNEYSDETSGFKLLKRLHPARCILYSAYITAEVTYRAIKEYEADVVRKVESPLRLLEAVENAAREVCARPGRIRVESPGGWAPQKIVHNLFGTGAEMPPDIVQDVLGQLFPDNARLTLETLGGGGVTPVPVSRGRSVVLKVSRDDFEPVIVKLAPSAEIRSESIKYNEHVKDRLAGCFYAQLERTVEFWDLGGTIYNFLGSSLKALPSLTVFYQKETARNLILRPLRHFFKEVWNRYYSHPVPANNTPLFRVYDESLRLQERLKRCNCREDAISFPGLPFSFANPVKWALCHSEDSLIPGAKKAITHGDLHGDNLFVDGEYAWAIDFERTGSGHILRDFVELEVDIVTRMVSLPEDDLSLFYELAVILSAPSDPVMPLKPTARLLGNPSTHKALEVISGLRNLAREVTGYSDFREYLWGLLFDALFVSMLASDETLQRDRAMLLGAVLCGRLECGEKGWPPAGWPRVEMTSESSLSLSPT